MAEGEEVPGDSEGPGASAASWGRFELKREATDRATEDESTKTILRLEKFFDGPIGVLRLDLQFPDDKTDFEGDPFEPRRGDIKLRARSKSFAAWERSFNAFVEATFPTAEPENLGSGKYQISEAVRVVTPLNDLLEAGSPHKLQFETELQQTNSVAGDPKRKDISFAKVELTLYDVWRREYTMKLKVKPYADWMLDGRTGGVAEVEGGKFFGEDWRAWLMLGHRIWGPEDVRGTYGKRLELGLSRTF